mmetsp:Transcript_74711/g.169230  ORF Transcript_74711/g.169230 Transcript_74711/m.169230 type:complete len:244 (-) Transcript_74711:342-1073(-)
MLACKVSTASVFSLRVCSFVASSVSHHPLCSASSLASSIRRTRRSLIIFRTLTKGSSVTRVARAASTRLDSWFALACRKRAAFSCFGLRTSARRLARTEPVCSSCGRCFSDAPETAPLEMISMAFSIAWSSSVRKAWRDSKSADFFSQVAVRSFRYFWSPFIVTVVSFRLPSASALASSFAALVFAFSLLSEVACSTCAVRSWMSMSKECLAFISSFSKVVRSDMNLSCSFSSISTIPCDWNS